jgi:hypothetical protein
MQIDKRILSAVKKSFSKFDFTRLDEKITNEDQTRISLIEPLIEILGFSRHDDMLTEINAGWGQKYNKADLGLIIKGKKPEIIVECKKLGMKLTDKEASQLNGYFGNTEGSKIGILTNGLEWRFYAEYQEKNILHHNPFLILDFSEIDDSKIEQFSQFHKNNLENNLKQILEEANDTFFLEGFNDALTEELLNPSDDLIKAIFARMPGKRINDDVKKKLRDLINSNSIQRVLPKLMEEETKSGNIIITTGQELKIYHAVKTIIVNAIKKVDYSRISYRDQKNSFNILVDDNQRKMIAKITSNRDKYFLEIGGSGNKIPADNIENIVAVNKQIVDLAKSFLSD